MRKNLFKWHSYSALIALIPLIIIAVTGSILVFKVEIDTLLMPHSMTVASGADKRLSLDKLVTLVEDTHPNHIMGAWELFNDKTQSDTAYIVSKTNGWWYKVFVDQYQGKVLSTPVTLEHNITDWLLSLHYTFLLGVTGTFLGLIFALVLLFLGISGIILHRQFWKKFFTLRFSAARRIFYSDVHKFIGIVSSPIIIILAITGGYWNAVEALHELEETVKPHPILKEKLYTDTIDFQHLIEDSRKQIDGFEPTYFTFPYEEEVHITFFGEVPNTNILTSQYASTVTYDRNSGQKTIVFDIRNANGLQIFVDMFRKLHFGYFAGLPSKIIWCVLGLSPLWLALTGLYFYLFRQRKFVKKFKPSHLIEEA